MRVKWYFFIKPCKHHYCPRSPLCFLLNLNFWTICMEMKVLVSHGGNVSKLQINWVSACALDALTSMFKSTHCSLLYNWLFHNVLARVWGFNIDNSMLDLSSDWRTSTDGSWNTMHHPRIQWLTGTGWRGHTRHSLQYIRTYICKMMEHIFAFWLNMYRSGGFIIRQVRNTLCNMTENTFSTHYPCRTHCATYRQTSNMVLSAWTQLHTHT